MLVPASPHSDKLCQHQHVGTKPKQSLQIHVKCCLNRFKEILDSQMWNWSVCYSHFNGTAQKVHWNGYLWPKRSIQSIKTSPVDDAGNENSWSWLHNSEWFRRHQEKWLLQALRTSNYKEYYGHLLKRSRISDWSSWRLRSIQWWPKRVYNANSV